MSQLAMLRSIFIVIFILYTSHSFACECGRGLGKNFLNQVKKFEYVVFGRFMREQPESGDATLIIDEVYKGEIERDTIELIDGGTDCYHFFAFEPGTKLVIGLETSPYGNKKDAFVALGCVTSTLIVTENKKVSANMWSARLDISSPKISWVRSTMNLNKLGRKIKRRKYRGCNKL